MKTKQRLLSKKARIAAAIVAAALVVTSLAVGLTSTFAAKADITVDLTQQPNEHPAVAVGATAERSITGAAYATSSDTETATTPGGKIKGQPVRITGVKAGVAVISVGSTAGLVRGMPYQIFNNNNISAYTLKKAGEVYLSAPGKTVLRANYITTTPSSAAADIKWKSLQEGVATVDRNTGAITAVSKGAAVIVGEFTDKWGIERDLHILVGVATSLGGGDENNPNLADLMEWIAKGEAILGLPDNPYTTESLQNLQNAVNGGKGVVDMPAPTDQQVKDAVDAIKGAINGLAKKPTGAGDVIGPDAEGNYYRPVGDPPNVYEIVNPDGSLKHPRKYVYNTGDPTKGGNRPAQPSGGFYWVEDPAGSNIWKKVGGNGYLVDSPALWGGPDGAPGGGDDKEAIQMNDGSYWAHIGQNIWRKVNKLQLGLPTGGGSSEDPTYTPGTPVYEHTDGKFYIGPLGPDSDGKTYYYGDSRGPLGNGKVMSTANSQHVTDDKFYLVDGEMVPVVPVDPNGIKNVTVSPESATVTKGGTQAFTATVFKNNGTQDSAGVNWSVNSSLSSISAAGVLSVAASETATSLTVTATSKTDGTIKGTATVAISQQPSIPGLDANQPAIGGTVKIDNNDWLVVRRAAIGSENFVYLLSKTSQGYGQNFHGASSNYEGSSLQGRMTAKFSGTGFPTIKQIAVVPTLGTHSSGTATSEPTATLASAAGQTKDIFFAPSLKDALDNRTVFNSVLLAYPKRFWLRTSSSPSEAWDWLGSEDRQASANILGTNIDDMIGVWVKIA